MIALRGAILLASTAIGLSPAAVNAQTALPVTPGTDQATAAAPSQPVQADASTAASAGEQSRAGVEDIIVTATRRSVNLQNVPAAVEAVSAGTLKAFNITGVNQLPSLTSGFVVAGGSANNLFLRGIGSSTTGYNEAQGAIYIDGVYLANPAVGIFSFNNIDRVEVLKGPQGTLYGRNVTGGLVSVITRDPGTTPRLDASIGYGNYDTFTTNFYGSAPLTATLAANVAVFHQKQSKGWGINLFTGHDNQKSDETGVETKLLWRPGSKTKVTGSFIYSYNNRDIGSAYEVLPGTIGQDGTPYYGHYRDSLRIDPFGPTHIYIGSIKIQQDLGFASLMSLSAYQASNADQFYAALPILGQPVASQGNNINDALGNNKTFTQEFQLTSTPSSSRLDWLLGAFYFNDHTRIVTTQTNTCVANVCAPGFIPVRNEGRPITLSASVYGDGTYRFFTATKLTVGLRYTDEIKTLAGLVVPLPGQPNSVATLPLTTATYPGSSYTAGGVVQPGIPTRLHFSKLTYRFVLAQDVGDNIHLYVSHNLGFKSGTFQVNLFSNPPVVPELLYATEAGIKSELFDHRLRLNVSYFHYAYKNVQVRSVAGAPAGQALLQNAASERMNGVDADFSIAPVAGLTINGSVEYLNARFVDFPGTTCATPAGTKVVNGVTVGVVTTVPCNLAGFRPIYAPLFSGSIGAVYRFDTPVGTWTMSANNHYNHSYSLAADASVVNGAHNVVDASLGWTARSKRFDANLWVRNLTNEYVYNVGIAGSTLSIVPGAPRTFGATVGAHF